MTRARSLRILALGFALLLAAAPSLLAQVDARMLRQPDVSQTHIRATTMATRTSMCFRPWVASPYG
jgi:hypothetical protein